MLSLEEQQNVRRLLDSGTPENINLALELQKGLGFDWAAVGVDADYFLYLLGSNQETDTQKAKLLSDKLGFNLETIVQKVRLDTFLLHPMFEKFTFWGIQGQVVINDANLDFLDSLKYFKNISTLFIYVHHSSYYCNKIIKIPEKHKISKIVVLKGSYIKMENFECWENLREFQAEGAYIQNISRLSGAKKLNFLSLRNCQGITYEYTQYWLSRIPSLSKIYINNCDLTRLSDLSNLINLRELSLANNSLNTLATLGNLPKLELLVVSNNQILHVSEKINTTNFPSLKKLYLSNNKIQSLPKIWKLAQLNFLDLSDNALSVLPKELDLPKLEELYVQNNKIENLEIISSCTALKKLNYEQNPIQKMPVLANFSHLHAITRGEDIDGLGISQTDKDWFFALPLALREALFASAHKKNVYCKNLLQVVAHIQLFGKQLTTLAGLETAHNCQRLDMPNNQIQDLSPLSGLGKLTHLNCSKNLIQDFSPIQNLPIVRLNCANNPISDYRFLQKMPHLQTLDCSKTGLSILSFLKYCPHIQQVICRKNPVFILPKQTIPTLISLEISTYTHKLSSKAIHRFRRLNPQCTLKFS